MMIETVNDRAFIQKILCIWSRPVDAIDESNPGLGIEVNLLNKIDIVFMTAGVLNFAPAESDLAINSGEQRLLAFVRSRSWNILANQALCVIRQHSGWFAGRLVF